MTVKASCCTTKSSLVFNVNDESWALKLPFGFTRQLSVRDSSRPSLKQTNGCAAASRKFQIMGTVRSVQASLRGKGTDRIHTLAFPYLRPSHLLETTHRPRSDWHAPHAALPDPRLNVHRKWPSLVAQNIATLENMHRLSLLSLQRPGDCDQLKASQSGLKIKRTPIMTMAVPPIRCEYLE